MTVELYLRFPDRETMLIVASALSGVPDIENPDVAGWLDGTYWNLSEVGPIWEPTGDMITINDPEFGDYQIPEEVLVPGWHVIGLWHNTEETVPEALAPFRVEPTPSWPTYGR